MENSTKSLIKDTKCNPYAKIMADSKRSLLLIQSLFPEKFNFPLFDWTTYPKLSDIYSWLDLIIAKRPDIVASFNIGNSPSGHLIRGIKISLKPGNKAIFIESNIHGKDGITSAAATYLIMKLLFSKNPDVRDMAESVDWWIIPVLDVDGFIYTYEKSNPDFFDACRKSNYSRKPTNNNLCFDQCNGLEVTFESTPEIELLKKFIDTNIPKDYIKIYIGLHSGVQAVLTPCCNMEEFPPNYNQLMFVAKSFVDALFSRFHTQYSYGTSANILNKRICSRGSTDWAYAEKGVPIALSIGLPKDRAMPFQLPKRAILRLSKELLDGFIGLIKAVKELGYL